MSTGPMQTKQNQAVNGPLMAHCSGAQERCLVVVTGSTIQDSRATTQCMGSYTHIWQQDTVYIITWVSKATEFC